MKKLMQILLLGCYLGAQSPYCLADHHLYDPSQNITDCLTWMRESGRALECDPSYAVTPTDLQCGYGLAGYDYGAVIVTVAVCQHFVLPYEPTLTFFDELKSACATFIAQAATAQTAVQAKIIEAQGVCTP